MSTAARPASVAEPFTPARRCDRVEQLDATRSADLRVVEPDPPDRIVGGAIPEDPDAEAPPIPVVDHAIRLLAYPRLHHAGPPSVALTSGSWNIATMNGSSSRRMRRATRRSVVKESGAGTVQLPPRPSSSMSRRCPIFSCFVRRYAMFSTVGVIATGHPLDDLEAEAFEAAVLRRVVGHQPHRGDPEVDQDLRPDAVLAGVGREPEVLVRLDRVATLVLERVRPQLVTETDPASLVAAQVDHDALVLGRDLLQRLVELQPAVAAQRAEHVAGQALRVHAHEHVRLARHLAAHERHVLDPVEQALEHVRGEVAVLRGDAGLGHPADQLLAVAPEPDEVGDRDQLQARARRRTPRAAGAGPSCRRR